MSLKLTHPNAPGHEAYATADGWACSCGAGTDWDEPKTRARGAGAARRHLTAAARNNPWPKHDDDATTEATEGPVVPSRAEQAEAARQAAAEVRGLMGARKAGPPWATQADAIDEPPGNSAANPDADM